MENHTIAKSTEYKNHKLFAIYKADENGNEIGVPIFNFGKTKAQALLKHLKEFENWCEENNIENDEPIPY